MDTTNTTTQIEQQSITTPPTAVDYFIVVIDLSTEKTIWHEPISSCFATPVQALKFQSLVKAQYPDCKIQHNTAFFTSKQEKGRQELLAEIVQ